MRKLDKKAFALIELIVTIAVLGILVLLASPRFFGHTQNAELTKGFANAKSIEKASELYYMDHEDWPRLTDEPYTSEEIKSYSERIFDRTGQEANLDTEGNYYDIDYDKLSDYIQVPDDKKNYILQNPVGKVFYMDNLNETGIARVNYSNVEEKNDNPIPIGEPINFAYTGQPQSIELGKGTYKLEVWGAQGGGSPQYSKAEGGKGGYSQGIVEIDKDTTLNIYVGQRGIDAIYSYVDPTSETQKVGPAFNGGGIGRGIGASGGGASDIRLDGNSWSDRIIVAGGGGGMGSSSGSTVHPNIYGGGLVGTPPYNGSNVNGTAPNQNGPGTANSNSAGNGSLGKGGDAPWVNSMDSGGGGGGYYGGAAATQTNNGSGGGGSGYIGGVQDGQTIAGNQSMPNPNGGTMTGNSGNGLARITRVD